MVPNDHELTKTLTHSLITCSHTGRPLDNSVAKNSPTTTPRLRHCLGDRATAKRLAARKFEDEVYDAKHPARDFTSEADECANCRLHPAQRCERILHASAERLATLRMKRPEPIDVISGPRGWKR